MKKTTFKIGDSVTRLVDRTSGKIEKIDQKNKNYRYLVRFKPHWIAWCNGRDLIMTSALKSGNKSE